MRKLLVLFFVLTLSACASINNPLNLTRLAQIESAYGIALSAAVGYYRLYKINRCTQSRPESVANICARRSVVVALQQADKKAQVALTSAQRFVRANPTLNAGAVIDAAQLAVDAMRQIEQINGVY